MHEEVLEVVSALAILRGSLLVHKGIRKGMLDYYKFRVPKFVLCFFL